MNRQNAYRIVLKCAQKYETYWQNHNMFFILIDGNKRYHFFLPSIQTISKENEKRKQTLQKFNAILNDNPELKEKFLKAAEEYKMKRKKSALKNKRKQLFSILFSGMKK